MSNQKYNARMTTSKKRAKRHSSPLTAIFIPVAFFAGLAAGYLIWGSSTTASLPNPASSDDPSLGPENAPVTIVEFGDYQCPYCQVWHAEVLPRLLAEYGDQIRFIYRDYPLTGHSAAQPAAEAANCAGEQGAYWEFQEAVFGQAYGYGRSAYEQYARDLGLNGVDFARCIESGRHAEEVLADFRDGIRLGVNSTPTFFVNGTQLVGAQPYDVFRQLIDAELAQVK